MDDFWDEGDEKCFRTNTAGISTCVNHLCIRYESGRKFKQRLSSFVYHQRCIRPVDVHRVPSHVHLTIPCTISDIPYAQLYKYGLVNIRTLLDLARTPSLYPRAHQFIIVPVHLHIIGILSLGVRCPAPPSLTSLSSDAHWHSIVYL